MKSQLDPVKSHKQLSETIQKVCSKIAPVWPLQSFVAVNPYLGMIDKGFKDVAQDLDLLGDMSMTLPVSYYLDKLQDGSLKLEDLEEILTEKQMAQKDGSAFIANIKQNQETENHTSNVLTVGDTASLLSPTDWNRFMMSRVSSWSASYFDIGQATWKATFEKESIFLAWKYETSIDKTTELTGLKGFRKLVADLPENATEAIAQSLAVLEVSEELTSWYLHGLLRRIGGWSAYAAQLDWDLKLAGKEGGKLEEFLAILISWEACLYQSLASEELEQKWKETKFNQLKLEGQRDVNQYLVQKLILQEAFDRSAQKALIRKFKNKQPEIVKTKPKAQAIFCIDVRSEVYRRNLEAADSQIETIGFAGFFGFPIQHTPLAHNHGDAQCPVLLSPGATIQEHLPNANDQKKATEKRLLTHQVKYLWKAFKSGAVTCFSFVSATGLSYLPKLFTDSFGITRPVPNPKTYGLTAEQNKNKAVNLDVTEHAESVSGLSLEQRVTMGKNALKAMSLTDNFADMVMIVGHGSTSVNNPHASGLDCGACGGQSGEPNAKVAAAVLNDTNVRAELAATGLNIPDRVRFLACLHDTTSDDITVYNESQIPVDRMAELEDIKKSLALASASSRIERALRMPKASANQLHEAMRGRATDWSQIRPEWGLAGCSAFVVAPREHSKQVDLGGKSFLHNYDWKKDSEFGILEVIMTAPMIVTSWINLQYYASTVDNKNFGSGNKTLHNVTAGIGVIEGYSGDLRVGLPMQSVHDGENFQHDPLRLNVVIEAPTEAINKVIAKHPMVRNLVDNQWIYLMAMNDEGQIAQRYTGNQTWETV